MKKKFLCLLALCMVGSYVTRAQFDPGCTQPNLPKPGSQNLILNGDFEHYSNRPLFIGNFLNDICQTNDLEGFTTWYESGSADFFTRDALSANVSVPTNVFTANNVEPRRAGQNTYAGLLMQDTDSRGNMISTNGMPIEYAYTGKYQYRESIGIMLQNPLVAGKTYYAEMWVYFSCASVAFHNDWSMLISNEIGNTGQGQYIPRSAFGTNLSEMKFLSCNYSTSSGGSGSGAWYKVAGSFVALAGQQYLRIGNFEPKSTLTKNNNRCNEFLTASGVGYNSAYAFIDDLFLGEMANAGADVTVDCSKPNVTLTSATPSNSDLYTVSKYSWTWVDNDGITNTVIGKTVDVPKYLFKQGSTDVTLKVEYSVTGNCMNTSYTDIVQVTNTCCPHTAVKLNPPTTDFVTRAGATAGIGPVISASINAANYGGTVNLNGIYRITSNITLSNGTFNIMPGSIIYVDGGVGSTKKIITLINSNLKIVDATVTCINDLGWDGFRIEDIYSEVETNSTSTDANCFTAIMRASIAFHESPECKNTIKALKLNKTNFYYNGRSVLVGHGLTASSYITNNIFSTVPQKDLNRGIAEIWSSYHIGLDGGTQGMCCKLGEDYSLATVSNNLIEKAGIGILSNNAKTKIVNNTFKNNYQQAYLNIGYILNNPPLDNGLNLTDAGGQIFSQNTIYLPSTGTTYGIYSTLSLRAVNNTILGTRWNTPAGNARQIAIYNASPFWNAYQGNTISDVHEGVRLKTFNTGTVFIQQNNFSQVENNILIPGVSNYTLGTVKIPCNTFANPGNKPGINGIMVENGGFLNTLGGINMPNGNAFSGSMQPVKYDGTNGSANFQYYRYNSAQENPTPPPGNLQITGGKIDNFQATSYTANANTCTGNNGVSARLGDAEELTEAEAKEMLNQIRFKYCNDQDMVKYGGKLVDYYLKTKKTDDLYAYFRPMNAFNKKAYNSFGLYLMDYYRGKGSDAIATAIGDALVKYNVGNAEIASRVQYSVLNKRLAENYSLFDRLSVADSTTMAGIASSSSSVQDIACTLLRLRYPEAKCAANPSAANARMADVEDVLEEGNTADTYLGNCLPNPASSEVLIYFNVPEGIADGKIRILNPITGTLICEIPVQGKDYFVTDVTNFTPGVYAYSLVVNGRAIATKKMVVIR